MPAAAVSRPSPAPAPDYSEPPPIAATVFSNSFIEKELVRLLIEHGTKILPDGSTLTAYIIGGLGDLSEQFEEPLYQKIIAEIIQFAEKKIINPTEFFIQHNNPEVASFAINCLISEHEYSANWIKKLNFPMISQPPKEENYLSEAKRTILKFKLHKVQQTIQLLLAQPPIDTATELINLKVHQMLLAQRSEIVRELRVDVLW